MRSLRVAGVVVCVVLVGSACGRDESIEVGMREYSTDIVYGSQRKEVPPAPLPAANPTPGFPPFIVPPPPARVVTQVPTTVTTMVPAEVPPVPLAPACPEDDPFDFPREPATRLVGAAPKQGRYRFRQEGAVAIGSVAAAALPTETSREIRNVATVASNAHTYDVVVESLGDTTTTSYSVRQSTGDPSLDGVFITRVVTRRADGSVDEFTPVSGVRIIALPAAPAASWNDVGTDPLRGTSMIVRGTVTDKGRVNACGTPLDSWAVKVEVRLLGAGKDLTVSATYQVGTQFGGFVLGEQVALRGTDRGQTVDLKSATSINDIQPEPLQ